MIDKTFLAVARVYGIKITDIKHLSRKRVSCEPRMLAIGLLIASGQYTGKDMAQYFNLHHSSMSHAKKTVRGFVETCPAFRKRATDVLELIYDYKNQRDKVLIELIRK